VRCRHWQWPEENVMTNRLDRWKRPALFALLSMLLVLPGLAGVRDVGLERAAGRLRRRCRPVAPAARERRQHVLALPAAVRAVEPGATHSPSGGRGGGR